MSKAAEHEKSFGPPEANPPSYWAGPSSTPATFRTSFACVTLNMEDRIRFINFPASDVAALHDTIQTAWAKGIQEFRPYGQAQEVKLRGQPWRGGRWYDVSSRVLLRKVLERLYDLGWVLQAPVSLIKEGDKDSLFFRHQSPPPPPCEWHIISFERGDRLKIVDPPPAGLAGALLRTLGTTVSKHERVDSHFEVKFSGYPWTPSGEETVQARILVLRILETLETFGFSLYASINQFSTVGEADVLVIHRQRDWVPGMPIFHR